MKKMMVLLLIVLMMIPAYLPNVSASEGGVFNYEGFIYWLNTEGDETNNLYYSLDGEGFGWPSEPTVITSPYRHKAIWVQNDWYIPSHITLVNIPVYVESENGKIIVDGKLIQQPTEEGSFYSALDSRGDVELGKDAVVVGDITISDGASLVMEKGAKVIGDMHLQEATVTGDDNYIQGCIYAYSGANNGAPVTLSGRITANRVSVGREAHLKVSGSLQVRTRIRGQGKLTVLSGGELIFNADEGHDGSTGCSITLESGATMYTLCGSFILWSGAVFELKKNSTVYSNGYFGVDDTENDKGFVKGEGKIILHGGCEFLVRTEMDELRFSANENIPNVDSTVEIVFEETHEHTKYQDKMIYDAFYHWYPCAECVDGTIYDHTFSNTELTEGYNLHACKACPYYYLNVDQTGIDINNGINWSVTDGVLKLDGSGTTDWMDLPLEFQESVTEIQIGEGITDIGCAAFRDYARLEKVVIPQTVNRIGADAFAYCRNLSEIVLPDTISVIEDCAFAGCLSLKAIQLPKGLTKIGFQAFAGAGLTSVKIPGGVEEFGEYAFSGCRQLKEARFSEGIVSVHEGAFLYCTNLTSVHLPKSIQQVNVYAFGDCWDLKTVYYNGSEGDFAGITVKSENNCFLEAEKVYAYRMPDTAIVKNIEANTLKLSVELPEAETTANTKVVAVGYNKKGVLTSVGTAEAENSIIISAEGVNSVQVMLFDLITMKPLSHAEKLTLQ